MNIKKAYAEIHAVLSAAAEANKTVGEVLDQITELCSSKTAGGGATTVHRNDAGEVTHVLDYYFKLWLPVSHVEFGAKANSGTGLNTMCKFGVSQWTKQQRDHKRAKEALLDAVATGEVAPDEISDRLAELDAAKDAVVPFPIPGIGWATIEEALAVSTDELDRLVADYEASQVPAEAPAEGESEEAPKRRRRRKGGDE